MSPSSPVLKRSLLLALLPFGVTALLVLVIFGRAFWNLVPSSSDEIDYYLEILAVRSHGFNFGYFTPNEHTALLAFKQFGAHGPVYPLLYGALSLFTGWGFASVVLLNCSLIGISLVIFDRLVQLNNRDFWLFLLVILGSYAVWIYLPSAMEESLNFSVLIVLSAFLILSFKQGLSRNQKYAYYILLVLSVTLRPTFAVFFLVPMLVSNWKEKAITIALLILSIVFDLLCWGGFARVIGSSDSAIKTGTSNLLLTLWAHVQSQTSFLLFKHEASWLEVGLRHETLLILILCICLLLWQVWNRRKTNGRSYYPLAFHILNLGSILVSLLLFYDVFQWRDYRMLAPHLLVSCLVMLADKQMRAVLWVFVGASVLLAYPFLIGYKYLYTTQYLVPPSDVEAFSTLAAPHVRYSPGLTAWDNTLLYVTGGYREIRMFAGLPAGIGLSFSMVPNGLALPPHSKYILIEPSRLKDWQGRVQLKPILETPWGLLAENISSGR